MYSKNRPVPSSDKNDIIHEISDDINVDIATFLRDVKIGAKFTPTPRVTESALQSFPSKYCKLGGGETNDISFDMLILQLCIQTILPLLACPNWWDQAAMKTDKRATNVNTHRTIGSGTWDTQRDRTWRNVWKENRWQWCTPTNYICEDRRPDNEIDGLCPGTKTDRVKIHDMKIKRHYRHGQRDTDRADSKCPLVCFLTNSC
jgi:hypothetical protein